MGLESVRTDRDRTVDQRLDRAGLPHILEDPGRVCHRHLQWETTRLTFVFCVDDWLEGRQKAGLLSPGGESGRIPSLTESNIRATKNRERREGRVRGGKVERQSRSISPCIASWRLLCRILDNRALWIPVYLLPARDGPLRCVSP